MRFFPINKQISLYYDQYFQLDIGELRILDNNYVKRISDVIVLMLDQEGNLGEVKRIVNHVPMDLMPCESTVSYNWSRMSDKESMEEFRMRLIALFDLR